MPQVASPAFEQLTDLTRAVQTVEGFPAILDALRQGPSATVDGAWGSSAGLATAALALHAPRTVLVVIPHPRDVDGWQGDLQSFSGLRPSVFPAWDNQPTSADGFDEVAGQRLRLLRQLDSGEAPRVALATFQALIQPVPGRGAFVKNRRGLRAGSTYDLEDLAAWLVEHGYRHTDAVELPGEFSRRGGILDVFSPDAETPYRVEFFGDDIESIRPFSPDTQRSLGTVEAVELTGLIVAGTGNNGTTALNC